MKVLDNDQINQKIVRLAFQIAEENIELEEIVLLGINVRGYKFAELLHDELVKIC